MRIGEQPVADRSSVQRDVEVETRRVHVVLLVGVCGTGGRPTLDVDEHERPTRIDPWIAVVTIEEADPLLPRRRQWFRRRPLLAEGKRTALEVVPERERRSRIGLVG